jgi:hypothetical protein
MHGNLESLVDLGARLMCKQMLRELYWIGLVGLVGLIVVTIVLLARPSTGVALSEN